MERMSAYFCQLVSSQLPQVLHSTNEVTHNLINEKKSLDYPMC